LNEIQRFVLLDLPRFYASGINKIDAKTEKNRTKTLKKVIFSIEKAAETIEKALFSIENTTKTIEKLTFSIENAIKTIERNIFSIEKVFFSIENETKTIESTAVFADSRCKKRDLPPICHSKAE
jgi:prophage DNA circulation protein